MGVDWWHQLGSKQLVVVIAAISFCVLVVVVIGLFKVVRSLLNQRSLLLPKDTSSPTALTQAKEAEFVLASVPGKVQIHNLDQTVAPTSNMNLSRFVDVPLKYSEKYTFSVENIPTRPDRVETFLKSAWAYASCDSNVCDPAPCNISTPNYTDFNDDQRSWYFYWRSQVRDGKFPPTDQTYINLHSFEITSLIETPDPTQAAKLLRELWSAYRSSHRGLDYSLTHMGGDLLAHKVSREACFDWWFNFRELEVIPIEVMNAGVHYFTQNSLIESIPVHIWYSLVRYDARNHTFYKKEDYGARIDAAVMQAIRISNDYWYEQRSKTLLDACCTNKVREVKKIAFVAVIVPKDYPRQITLGEGRDYHEHNGLREHVASLIKYAENAIRESVAYKRRLEDIILPVALEDQLRKALWPKPDSFLVQPNRSITSFDTKLVAPPNVLAKQKSKISINLERVATLHIESREIESLLSENESAIIKTTETQQIAMKALLTDLASVRKLWQDLGEPHKQLITYLIVHQPCNTETLKLTLPIDQLVHVTIDAINEQAVNHLKEIIIRTQDAQILLEEDFVDELQVVLHESPPLTKVTMVQQEAGLQSNSWRKFVESLTLAERDLAGALALDAVITNQYIDELARSYHMMGSVLLDQFSEKSIALLTHLIVYPDGDNWYVDDDDLPLLRQALTQ